MTRTIALGVAYDGGAYHGWQRQRDVSSVQQDLEQALTRIVVSPVVVYAAGRTDTGVHATGQVVHFACPVERPLRAWLQGVNSYTPQAMAVQWAQEVPDDFHARFSAAERRYQYVFLDDSSPAPLLDRQCWQVWRSLDADAMHDTAQLLLGEHDFSAFRGAGCQAHTALRRIHSIRVVRFEDLVVLDVAANAFLLHMVRNIAGALIQVGQGDRPGHWLAELLAGRDRTRLGPTAPPQGLYLTGVRYPGYEFPLAPPPPPLRALGPLARL